MNNNVQEIFIEIFGKQLYFQLGRARQMYILQYGHIKKAISAKLPVIISAQRY
jgi:hypothetical protein